MKVSGSSATDCPAVSAIRCRYSASCTRAKLLMRRRARRHDLAPAIAPAAGDDVHDLRPFRALGMSWRRLVLGEPFRADEDQRHPSSS